MFAHAGRAADPRAHREAARRGRQAEARVRRRRRSRPTSRRSVAAARRRADPRAPRSSRTRRRATTATASLKKKLAETLTAELGAEKFAEHEKLIKDEFEERKAHVVRELRAQREASASTAATRKTIRPIIDARSASSRACTARRSSSAARRRRSSRRRSARSTDEQKIDAPHRRALEALLPPLQLPALLDRRDQADARPRPSRDRPRRPRRARARCG